MSRLRNSPRLRKGALVAFGGDLPVPMMTIAFQYNPETMSRSLKPNISGQDGSITEVRRVDNPPTETIKLEAEFDATDGLERREPVASRMGVYPQISALESLLYPASLRYITNAMLANAGTIEIIPPLAPLVLFIWGSRRVLPVRVEALSVEETAYDERLNPIQAKVDVDLRVLSYADFQQSDPGSWYFLAHQMDKERLARLGSTISARIF